MIHAIDLLAATLPPSLLHHPVSLDTLVCLGAAWKISSVLKAFLQFLDIRIHDHPQHVRIDTGRVLSLPDAARDPRREGLVQSV
jgi:hypothetical protein